MEKNLLQEDWKEKAKSRRLENKLLKQRSKELVFSRGNWKAKALSRREQIKELEAELDQALKALDALKK